MIPPPRSGFFLSLKWKALLLSSIALIAVTGTLVSVNDVELRKQFEQRRADLQNQYLHQVQGLMDQSERRLQQWSTAVASLLSLQAAKQKMGEGMVAEFKRLAAILELDMGVESIALVAGGGERLAAHGLHADFEHRVALGEAIRGVLATENPASLIDCFNTCLQYAIAPVFDVGDALIMGVSLADVVLDFQRVSGTDLGLIVTQDGTVAREGADERYIAAWNVKVAALSDSLTNMTILRAAAQTKTLVDGLRESIYVTSEQREYDVRVQPLSGFDKRAKAYLVVVADISEAMANIRTTLRRNLALGVVGLVLSEVLLLAILWAPMSRLRRAAAHLPWLADGAFGKIRSAVAQSRLTHLFRDEVDVLNETAVAVSHQLEALNTEVAKQTRDLSERMSEIIRQRNFVTHILETAQAIILTLNRNNEILMINPYGQAITGYSAQELKGRAFVTLLLYEDSADRVGNRLAELVAGDLAHLEEECDVRCKDQSALKVVWQHSRLKGQGDDAALILSVGMDITARKKAELRLAWLADHDPLTGLYNRRRFGQELNDAVAASRRYRRAGALLFLDLDQFKYINDTSGHHAGDQLLQRLGEMLPSILREVDVIGRLGGDEFAVILKQATADEAVQVAKKILDHICEIEFPVEERVHKLSASIGIALFPEHGLNIEELLARADLAMYQVKDSGRGNWYLLSSEDQSQRLMRERVFWKQQIENALKENRFLLFVQPIFNIQDQSVSHYEVLLRMQGGDGELIGPTQFIEVAERTGLIHSIDRMVMTEAIRYQALAMAQGARITLTVNLSAHAFNNPNLLDELKQLLLATGLDPKQLIFEMTETAALADMVSAHQLMEAINEIGCQFALDDFGTGFSSFYYLKKLPFEFVKIDGSFINKLAERSDDQVLVKAMGEIAAAFGKKTIAEQVEDEQTLTLLGRYGIDYAQGYHVGRPIPIMEMLAARAVRGSQAAPVP